LAQVCPECLSFLPVAASERAATAGLVWCGVVWCGVVRYYYGMVVVIFGSLAFQVAVMQPLDSHFAQSSWVFLSFSYFFPAKRERDAVRRGIIKNHLLRHRASVIKMAISYLSPVGGWCYTLSLFSGRSTADPLHKAGGLSDGCVSTIAQCARIESRAMILR